MKAIDCCYVIQQRHAQNLLPCKVSGGDTAINTTGKAGFVQLL